MPKIRLQYLAALATLAFVGAASANLIAYAGKQVPLTSLGIKTPLLVFDSGRLYQVDSQTGKETPISDHRLTGVIGEFDAIPSEDGRQIAYSGAFRDDKIWQTWLYDSRTGRDRVAFEHPVMRWGESHPDFSPDGKLFLISVNYDDSWPSGTDNQTGLYLVDTETLQRTRIGLPTGMSLKEGSAKVRWSADGKEVLIAYSRNGERNTEYFSYRLATRQVEEIQGVLADGEDDRFVRAGAQITLSPRRWMRSSKAGIVTTPSPDGQWQAYLSDPDSTSRYFLEVKGKDGVAKRVAVSHNLGPCNGRSLFIGGWIDNRYLVYEVYNKGGYAQFFAFDPATGNRAALFEDKEWIYEFTW